MPNDRHRESSIFKQVKTFMAPPVWLPPKRLVQIRNRVSRVWLKEMKQYRPSALGAKQ